MATFSLHSRLQEPPFLGQTDRQLPQLPLLLPQADSDLVYDDVSAVAATSDPAWRRNTEADDEVYDDGSAVAVTSDPDVSAVTAC